MCLARTGEYGPGAPCLVAPSRCNLLGCEDSWDWVRSQRSACERPVGIGSPVLDIALADAGRAVSLPTTGMGRGGREDRDGLD
jgi:hypothetical protein